MLGTTKDNNRIKIYIKPSFLSNKTQLKAMKQDQIWSEK